MEFINYIKSINGNIFSLITTFIGILGGWYIDSSLEYNYRRI